MTDPTPLYPLGTAGPKDRPVEDGVQAGDSADRLLREWGDERLRNPDGPREAAGPDAPGQSSPPGGLAHTLLAWDRANARCPEWVLTGGPDFDPAKHHATGRRLCDEALPCPVHDESGADPRCSGEHGGPDGPASLAGIAPGLHGTDEAYEHLPAKLAQYCHFQLREAIGDDPTCVAQMLEQVVIELNEIHKAEYDTAYGRRERQRRLLRERGAR